MSKSSWLMAMPAARGTAKESTARRPRLILAWAGTAGVGACRRGGRVRAARAMSLAAVLAVPAVATAGTVVNFFEADNFAQGPPDYNDLAYVGQGAFSDPGNNHWNGFAPPGFGT